MSRWGMKVLTMFLLTIRISFAKNFLAKIVEFRRITKRQAHGNQNVFGNKVVFAV